MTTDDDVPIKDLMETEIISVYTHADQEQVAQLFTKYDLLALPVIDLDGRMWYCYIRRCYGCYGR